THLRLTAVSVGGWKQFRGAGMRPAIVDPVGWLLSNSQPPGQASRCAHKPDRDRHRQPLFLTSSSARYSESSDKALSRAKIPRNRRADRVQVRLVPAVQ